MSDIHAGPLRAQRFGLCRWRHHSCGVDLACHDQAIPGLPLCADHFIAWAHDRADRGIPVGVREAA